MKRQVSPLVAAVSVVIAISVAIGVVWVAQPATGAPSPSLDELSSQELANALDQAIASDSDRALLIAQRLWQRRGGIPRNDLRLGITDKTKPQASRELMLDMLAGNPGNAQVTDDARDLLLDSRLDSALKARILVNYRFDRADSALLSSLVSGTDGLVAFHALKRLGKTDPPAARQIALATLSRAEDSSDSKLSASYKVLVRSGTLANDSAAQGQLLRHLESTLADKSTSPELLDSATFALYEMKSLDALRIVLESTSIDRPLVVGAIDENAAVIKGALEQDPDESTIELAVTAMEIYPVKDLAEPLRAAKHRVQSPALRQRLADTLVLIAREGLPINPRSTED